MTALLAPAFLAKIGPDQSGAATAMSPDRDIDLEALAADLDALRDELQSGVGAEDAAYIRRLIRIQRNLDLAGRAALIAGVFPPAWIAGVGMLGLAKILENMEIGHNVMHGQYDWMRDPEIHSTRWEWDNVCPASQWKHSHNYVHHQWTNVLGMDNDIGYGVLRISPQQRWHPRHLVQPAVFVALALAFEYGVGSHDIESDLRKSSDATPEQVRGKVREFAVKIRRQVTKDYVALPLLALPLGPPAMVATASGALAANVIRNLWSFTVIFCGHFPDDVELFPHDSVQNEGRGGWYRRQILGSANFEGGRLMHLLTGNLDHQIEHHLFPDLPANRYAAAAPRVREICDRHGLRYNTGSFMGQFATVIRKVVRLSVPW